MQKPTSNKADATTPKTTGNDELTINELRRAGEAAANTWLTFDLFVPLNDARSGCFQGAMAVHSRPLVMERPSIDGCGTPYSDYLTLVAAYNAGFDAVLERVLRDLYADWKNLP